MDRDEPGAPTTSPPPKLAPALDQVRAYATTCGLAALATLGTSLAVEREPVGTALLAVVALVVMLTLRPSGLPRQYRKRAAGAPPAPAGAVVAARPPRFPGARLVAIVAGPAAGLALDAVVGDSMSGLDVVGALLLGFSLDAALAVRWLSRWQRRTSSRLLEAEGPRATRTYYVAPAAT